MHNKLKAEVHPGHKLTGPKKKKKRPWPTRDCYTIKNYQYLILADITHNNYGAVADFVELNVNPIKLSKRVLYLCYPSAT